MESSKIIALFVLLAASSAMAGLSLEITKAPIAPVPSWSGPPQDAHAELGQWFREPVGPVGVKFALPCEFYDNKIGNGGGVMSTEAIYGKVISITHAPTMMITAFVIKATITNDTDSCQGPWRTGTNSHGEYDPSSQPYQGTLYNTILTADFALSLQSPGQVSNSGPYRVHAPIFFAINDDLAAWYCWDPNRPYGVHDGEPNGRYSVPAWRFGNIAPGESSTVDLSFQVDGDGLAYGDPRYQALWDSFYADPNDPNYDGDVFLNRTTSLKISDWMDDPLLDEKTAYPSDTEWPEDPLRNSDVSVFHDVIPEPVTLSLLALAGPAILRRRRPG